MKIAADLLDFHSLLPVLIDQSLHPQPASARPLGHSSTRKTRQNVAPWYGDQGIVAEILEDVAIRAPDVSVECAYVEGRR